MAKQVINPLQFNADEDFEKYPRSLEKDFELASKAGAIAVWAPKVNDVFPGGSKNHFKIEVPKKLISQLCGSTRPGHFNGVATVIIRLIKIINPKICVHNVKNRNKK